MHLDELAKDLSKISGQYRYCRKGIVCAIFHKDLYRIERVHTRGIFDTKILELLQFYKIPGNIQGKIFKGFYLPKQDI